MHNGCTIPQFIRIYDRIYLSTPGRFNIWGDVLPEFREYYGKDIEDNWYRIDSHDVYEIDYEYASPIKNKELIKQLEEKLQEKYK